jgi:transcriptional regulator with XRE-family HTH domain
MREELSRRLREKRKRLNLSIEEVVERTKLHPSVIKDIEAGRWEDINPTYLKGFIKIYCSFLGERFDEGLFKDIIHEEEKPQPREVVDTRKNLVKLTSFFLEHIKLISVIALGIVLIWGVSFLVSKIREKSLSPKVNTPSRIISQDVPLLQEDEFYVTLTVKRDCFVRVKLEGELVFEGILNKGVVETWKAKEEIDFKISDGSAVDVEVNGKLLPPLTKIRKPIKSLKITPSSISVEK